MNELKFALVAGALATLAAGCALERADPAARSARVSNGALTITATEGSTITVSFAEGALGAMTAADGEGAITQPTTQTTKQDPEFAGALDPVSAGIATVGKLGVKAIDAYSASKSGSDGKSATGQPCTGPECSNGSDCSDGSCSD